MRLNTPSRDSTAPPDASFLDGLRRLARPLDLDRESARRIARRASQARCVLIGEASHGTNEFYAFRAEITEVLIAEHGFDAVAVEADWPDAFRVNRYVRGHSDDDSSDASLGSFTRFPRWMWRNEVVLDFIAWLRLWNVGETKKAGFYGLDLYSLNSSLDAVLAYLDRVDPEAARRARDRYACFDHFGDDAQQYGYATAFGAAEPCEDEAVQQLVELQQRAGELALRDGQIAADEFFSAEQNARLARNAEQYYREMYRGDQNTWNLRDRHMAETLDALLAHLDRVNGRSAGQPSQVVVWAHNSHLGDARATEMGRQGDLNLGQLVRERHGADAFLIGMSTDHGAVSAASDWGAPVERKRVRPGLPGSYEQAFHVAGLPAPAFLLDLHADDRVIEALRQPRLQRAIGVIYRPQTERLSHYFSARLADQFDLVVHIDETHALRPLDLDSGWEEGELPDTYPSGV
jgi:erythromycin esterase-like protein